MGILIAGDTPTDKNSVQIHQDKLGEYVRNGGTVHGRPSYKKDNNTNHMLWFAHAADGTPTWYVGKKEEFGQPRGWLQVKCDALTPQDIKGSWSVWSGVEKQWREAREVKCIAVSATPGVIIHGPTPNNLLQDKLGEYRRVQLRVITDRGVYEMVGMPNVMMWYAPGGTWNIGKRDELGQNRGWYQAVSKAISPEGISNWQVWDGANKKWEKAADLEAISVGSKRISFTGTTPKNVNADKLGEYVRKGFSFHEGRAVYECVDTPSRSIWYATPYWYLGQTEDVGKTQGWLCCKDDASSPELVKVTWRVSDGQHMVDSPEVRCIPVGARTVMVAGETPNGLNSDKLGEFVRRLGKEMNGRPIYSQVGNDNRMLWYSAGYWYLGKKDELGKSQGWLCVRDPAPAPELVQSLWRVGDGEKLHHAANVKCAAIGARTIEVLGNPINGLHKDKMGEFRMIAAMEVNGKPVYEKEPLLSHMVWASNGYWYVGKRDELGKQAGWMQVRDSAPLPEEISGIWQIWNQSDKRWIPSENVKVTAVGNERVSIMGPVPAACAMHQDKLGCFRRLRGMETNGYAIYRQPDNDVMLWHSSCSWWVGPGASLGKQAGYWRCTDSARVPEAIKATWEVGDGLSWHKAESVRCVEKVRQRLLLKGSTPEDRHQDKLGVYVLCQGELINDRVCYQQLHNPQRMIWFLTPYWYVGKRDEKSLGQGWLQVRSLAPVPEQIMGSPAPWCVWNSSEKRWIDAPDLSIVPDPESEDAPEMSAAGAPAPLSSVPKALPIARAASLMVDEEAPGTAVIATTPVMHANHYDCYIAHDWGQDSSAGQAHARAQKISEYLRAKGLTTWFDSDRMQGRVIDKICSGIDDSELVIVCISKEYIEKVGGKNGAMDHCKVEFEYAERTKGTDHLIPVVIDAAVRSSREWRGGVGLVLGSRSFKDLAAEEDPWWEAGLQALYEEILFAKGTGGAHERGACVGNITSSTPRTPQPPVAAAERRSSGERTSTMAEKVARIKQELHLDSTLPIAKAVAEANHVMDIEPQGSLAKQVECLLTQLGAL